jgi:hypothetical protein
MLIEAYSQRKKYEAQLIANAIARLFVEPEERMSSDEMLAMLGMMPK